MNSKKILRKIKSEEETELTTLSLIPSENILSKKASEMYSLRNHNRYVLPLKFDDKEYMPGREKLEDLLKILKTELSQQYNRKYVLIEPLSGLNLMDLVLSGLRNKFQNLVLLDPYSGGHGSSIQLSRKYKYTNYFIDIDKRDFDLDYKQLDKLINKIGNRKTLIYLDHTVVIKPIELNKLIKRIPSNWYIYYDISHLQLFYFTKIYKLPKNKKILFGGSTHKSFPGPQKAIALSDNKELYGLIKNESNSSLSSIHTGDLMALLITVLEMKKFGKTYAKDILDKTKLFAKLLKTKLDVIGPLDSLTHTHQVWINVKDPRRITKDLAEIGIITTPIRIPIIRKEGLRLGIQELCRLGISKKNISRLAKIISECINKGPNNNLKRKVTKIANECSGVEYGLT